MNVVSLRRTFAVLTLASLALAPARGQLPAFPGAEGFGRYATGGRGGSVYYVTTTADSGPGSFRDAVSQPDRTVVFAVSGVIDYQPPRYNVENNVTIAGQTAPGDGVVLYGDGIGFTDANHTITRFIRFRMGHDAVGEDAVGVARGHDMVFDHISATWSLDEVFSVSGSPEPENITIQSSIIGQGLETHSAGGLIQTSGGVSILRCLYIDNGTRNPKVKGVNEFVNNVIYNWSTDAYILGDSAGQSYANIFGNYFINGPDSGADGAFSRGNLNFHLYAVDNWQDRNGNGVLDGTLLTRADYDVNDWQSSPFAYPIAVGDAFPPLTAVKLAVSDVGPSLHRDEVDGRLITELTSWGTLGQTIYTEFDPPMNGPGAFRGGPAPLDTDLDGMPDYWESALGMSTHAPNNNDPSPSGSGYTRLEDYLNWLAEPHGVAPADTTVDVDLRQFTRGFLDTSPVYSVSGVTNGTYALVDGHTVRFTPAAGFAGPAGFDFTVTDAQGSTITRTMGLFFTPQPPAYGRTWRGDDAVNTWDVAGAANWFDGQALLYPFRQGDGVVFDDTGSTQPAVDLLGSLQPSHVWVNADADYVLSGSGSLDGPMTLDKSGEGTLILAGSHGYTGTTTVSNGAVIVNGALGASPLLVREGATLGGAGSLGVTPLLRLGSILDPGHAPGAPGELTVSSTLSLFNGTTVRFDLGDDPAGTTTANDHIDVMGNLNLGGIVTLEVNLLDGPLGNGVYTLISYSGSMSGGLANLTLVGANGTLTNLPGAIGVHVDNTRPPASLVWAGDGAGNRWDDGSTPNWMNGALPDWFYFGDTVLFDDTGSASPAVDIAATVSPDAVTVDAAQDYTFGGSGEIGGTGGLLKANTGTLVLSTVNDFSGGVTLAGGVLSVAQLTDGGVPGPLGAASADPAGLVFDGGTLRYTGGNDGTDRGATLRTGGGTIDVASGGTVVTLDGTLTGAGILGKAGPGRLDFSAANTYAGGTVVDAGDVRMVNMDGFGSGPVILNGQADAATFRFGSDQHTLNNPLTVWGADNHVLLRGNNTLKQISGSGTFAGGLVDSGTTLTFGGDMSGFTGTFRAGSVQNPRFYGSTGSGSATFDLGDGSAKLNNRNGNLTAHVGALIGGSDTILEGASSANNPTTYVIGGKNLDTTFAGTIREVIPERTVLIRKVGTGTLTLTGNNTYTGSTTVDQGALLLNNTGGSGTGSGSITVDPGGVLGGHGSVAGQVEVNAGGGIAPGGGDIGTFTINDDLDLDPGAFLYFDVGTPGASDRLVVNGSLSSGGTLHVTGGPGFGPGSYTLITYSGSFGGSLPVVGTKPSGFSCSITSASGSIGLTVVAQTPPVFDAVAAGAGQVALTGSGPADETYHLLASPDPALPMDQWTHVATDTFDGDGDFSIPAPIDTNDTRRFYGIELP